MTQELLLGVTSQVLVIESPRPLASVPSVKLYELDADDTSAEESAVSGAATVDTASTTTSAAAGADHDDPTLVPVASASGFVIDRRYSITGDGAAEVFDLVRVDGTNLYARHPLVNSYATGATVKGNLRATIAVDDAWAADSDNLSRNDNPNARYRYRAAVTYATDVEGSAAASDVLYGNVDLVRYGSAPLVSPLDIEEALPGWLDGLGPDDRVTQGRRLIAEAADLVRDDLAGKGIAVRSLRSAEVHRRLVVARAVYHRIETNAIRGGASPDQVEIAKLAYDRQIAALVQAPVLAQDKSGGGAATTITGRSMPLTRR